MPAKVRSDIRDANIIHASKTYHFMSSFEDSPRERINGIVGPDSFCNNHPHLRKREIVHILDRSNRLSVDRHIGERSVVQRRFSKPVHGQDGSVSSEPVAATVHVRVHCRVNG